MSGLLLGFAFPPFPLSALAWGALVPLLLRWREADSAGRLLLEAYAAFLLTFAVAFSWPLWHALPRTALLSLGGLLTLPFLTALPVAASAAVRKRLGLGAGLLAFVSFFLVLELGLSRGGPLAFPWPLLGHTQAEALAFIQFADLTGVPGLSLWVLLTNVLIFLILIVSSTARRSLAVGSLVFLLAAPLLYGRWRLEHLPPPTRTAKVGLVQPALAPTTWSAVDRAERVDGLLALSDSLLALSGAAARLIIWPETALPVFREETTRHRLYAKLQSWTEARDVDLLTGAVTPAPRRAGSLPPYHNSALLFRPEKSVQPYHKTHLVPFAEGVPWAGQVPALAQLAVPSGGVAGYLPGSGPKVLRSGGLSLGVLICFESLFGNHARKYVAQDVDLLVALTQDGWWGRTAGFRQHLAFSRLRAVETRRALVQVAVTGTTALVLPSGALALETAWMERTARSAEVPLYGEETFYSRHGDWVSLLAAAVALLLAAAAFHRAQWRKREKYGGMDVWTYG